MRLSSQSRPAVRSAGLPYMQHYTAVTKSHPPVAIEEDIAFQPCLCRQGLVPHCALSFVDAHLQNIVHENQSALTRAVVGIFEYTFLRMSYLVDNIALHQRPDRLLTSAPIRPITIIWHPAAAIDVQTRGGPAPRDHSMRANPSVGCRSIRARIES